MHEQLRQPEQHHGEPSDLHGAADGDREFHGLYTQGFVGPHLFSPNAAQPGRGTLDSNGNTTGYIVSASKLVYINTTAAPPRVVVVEK